MGLQPNSKNYSLKKSYEPICPTMCCPSQILSYPAIDFNLITIEFFVWITYQ